MIKKTPLFKVNLDGLDDKPRWYTIVTNYNYEQKVSRDINKLSESNDMVYESFSGVTEVKEEKKNKKGEIKIKTKNIKLFPNYVFCKAIMNATTWSILTNITGVSAILCLGGTPVSTEEKKINHIKSTLNNYEINDIVKEE